VNENMQIKKNLNVIKTSDLIKNLAKETIGNETAQAFIRIFDTKYLCFKLYWLICMLACATLCFYLVAQTLMTYLSYPVFTTTTIVQEVPTVFPKITICNSMLATTEYAYNYLKELNEDLLPDINIFNKTQMRNLFYSKSSEYLWKVGNIFQARINGGSFSDDERQKLVHALEDVLHACQFNGQPCSASDFIWKWDPIYGNCYSFNSGLDKNGSKVNLKESRLPGTVFGLQLAVYVGYNDKLTLLNGGNFNWLPFSNSYGLNVLIENNTFLGNKKQSVIALNGGSINFMSMQRQFTSKLPKPYSDCDIDNTNPGRFDSPYYNLILNSPYQYSQDLCVIQCIQQHVIQMCNCSIPIYLDLYNVSCKNEVNSLCASNTIYDGNLSLIIHDCVAQCPLECNSTDISLNLITQTYSGVGSSFLIEQTPLFSSDFNLTQITEETTINKFVQLYAFYDSLSYTVSIDSPGMDIVSFLGSIGGTLGLFLGVSLLSVCELVHVIVESCLIVKNRLKNRVTEFSR
jgi:hypothetical protein